MTRAGTPARSAGKAPPFRAGDLTYCLACLGQPVIDVDREIGRVVIGDLGPLALRPVDLAQARRSLTPTGKLERACRNHSR